MVFTKRGLSKRKGTTKGLAFLPLIAILATSYFFGLNLRLLYSVGGHWTSLNNEGITEGPPEKSSSVRANKNVTVVATAEVSSVLQFQGFADTFKQLQTCPQSIGLVDEIHLYWRSPLPIPSSSSKYSPFYELLSSDAQPPLHFIARNLNKSSDTETQQIGNIVIHVNESANLNCSHWIDLAFKATTQQSPGASIDVVRYLKSKMLLAEGSRSILQTSCAPIGGMRPSLAELDTVPGTDEARNHSNFSFDDNGQFFKDGYVGPMKTSLTVNELGEAAEALIEHRKKVMRAARTKVSSLSAEDAINFQRLYGEMHVAKERCYAYDARCRKVAEDPAIISEVKKVIGDDVVVYAIDLFSKTPGEIQPWHTDIEPYDRCFGKNVQLWLAVDGVTPNSTLQIATGSHHMPSMSWLFPEHLASATTVEEKRKFEETTLRKCAESMDGTSRIVSPVMEDGQFIILHSNLWHGSENTHHITRRAIRIYYTSPECQPGAVYKYSRPDIPPFQNPIASVPPSLLVSGNAGTWPNRNRVVHNLLNFNDIPIFVAGTDEENRWAGVGNRFGSAVEVRSWSPDEVGQKWKTMSVTSRNSSIPVIRSKANFFKGQTPLFQRMDLEIVRLGPHEAAHGHESHRHPEVIFVVEGSLKTFTYPSEQLLMPNENMPGEVPEMMDLSAGSIVFQDAHGVHSHIGGENGAKFLTFKADVRDPWQAPKSRSDSKGLKFYVQPLEGNFLRETNFMHMPKVVGEINHCSHDRIENKDRESLVYVLHVPSNLRLTSLLDQKSLLSGSVLYYPLGSSHGIDLIENSSGEKLVPETHEWDPGEAPSCLWIDFLAAGSTGTNQ